MFKNSGSDDVDRGWEAYNTNVLYRDQGKKSSGHIYFGHLSVEYLLVATATSEFSGVDI
jgi:hypothetical protein